MASIESAVIRVVATVSEQLAPRMTSQAEIRQAGTAATEALLRELRRRDAEALEHYLDSPDFATVVAQHRVGNTGGKAAKDQLYQGLRLAGLSDGLLTRTAEVVHDVMVAACQEVAPQFGRTIAKVNGSDLYAAAASNSRLLKGLKSATRIHTFATRLRDQVVALHSRIRLPHAGVSRSVRYDQLYVRPTLSSPDVTLGAPGVRVLILGDPGAGKSTLAAKFAHDIAVDGTGRVPFLLVLREFATSFDEGGHDLLHYLEKLCQAPYNLKPPRDGVEYLLRTGRAVVVLDGLDELVQTELRRRVVSLVEGFAHLYPLVPLLVTARKIGYEDAPLSDDLFVKRLIAEFDQHQTDQYVRQWFRLDEATSPAEYEQLTRSFMEDSEQIPELRSNPLLLTLLCAMYSSDRYLPRNLAQAYERCALMLFEQWDSRRGIPLPLKFHGRLRGAVQHLAWTMFTAAESGKAEGRGRIVRILTTYLEGKLDDHDEASATALEFLDFCTGRAWILTDVGATATEPRFGFTHRTFLEYFAAEHLVRTHRTADQLWAAMHRDISQWDVVAQIVLQLYDRNVEGGADELLSEAIRDGGLGFAARSLHHVDPATRTVRAIARAAVDWSVFQPITTRLDTTRGISDSPVLDCLFGSSAANRRAVEQEVEGRLSELVDRGEVGAALVLGTLLVPAADRETRWPAIAKDLTERHHDQLTELWKDSPWAGSPFAMETPGILAEVVRRSGVRPLYADCLVSNARYNSVVVTVGAEVPDADLVATAMIETPQPWFEHDELTLRWIDEYDDPRGALGMMMTLPVLERLERRTLPPAWLAWKGLTAEVREFLELWEQGEITLIAPRPQRPR
ncbi:NACHT domain-containing protein [Lentzea sp. NPDC051838]|uniref:NACHT domain-containing protein n=1 Tax=Lentzea sp. NPDC051838 TaxID=3154849 RepID=UPI003424002F